VASCVPELSGSRELHSALKNSRCMGFIALLFPAAPPPGVCGLCFMWTCAFLVTTAHRPISNGQNGVSEAKPE
jgi:hypothetical protein